MEKNTISSWVRQARHRAKKQQLPNDLDIQEVEKIVEFYGSCAYCDEPYETLDHAFPLKDSAPNVAANILPSCKKCKLAKKNNDLVYLFEKEQISKDRYIKLLKEVLTRPGKKVLKEHIKAITGMF